MNWIKGIYRRCQDKWLQYHLAHQDKLILVICIPCMLLTVVALMQTETSGYLIAFFIICLSLLCSYVLVANKKYSQYQVRTLANLIESMIDGDYSLRGRLKSTPAFQELLLLINNLSDTLEQHKIAAKESRVLLELIVEQMDAMVLATDTDGNIVMANNSAQKLLLIGAEKYQGTALNSLPLGGQLQNALPGIVEFKQSPELLTKINNSGNCLLNGEFFLYKEKFLSDGKSHQLYLLTNAERLLMEKERNAWQSLLRVLSHEINNSLTPISTISQSIENKLKSSLEKSTTVDSKSLLEGINIINERADTLSEFISTYSQLAHLPQPIFTSVNLKDIISKLTLLFPQCQFKINQGIDIEVKVDKKQLEQVFINLFKNAIDAMSGVDDKIINISTVQERQYQKIIITDRGSGIANFDNIFVPFYTTKSTGSGIGLALCRQIMFAHNGQIKLQNNIADTGVEVSLYLPK